MVAAAISAQGLMARPKGIPLSPEHRGKFIAGGIRANARKRKRMAELAAGTRGLSFEPARAVMDASPAAWLSSRVEVGDSQYVDDGLDEVLLRALHERVVYGGSCCCHHEPVFQDVTLAVIAGAEVEFRKQPAHLRSRGLLQ